MVQGSFLEQLQKVILKVLCILFNALFFPRINPCGTPKSSVLKVLYMLLKLAHCFLLFKQE